MKKNHPQIVIESPNSNATTLDTIQMGNTAAISQTSKSGLTRKMNNAFRKHLIEFETGVLEAKIEQIKPEKWQEISEELYDIKSDFENRMEEAKNEAMQEGDERLQQLLTNEDKETVMAVAASDITPAAYLARYDIEGAIKDTEMTALTHLEHVKTAPIAELKEKYYGVFAEWLPGWDEAMETSAKLKARYASDEDADEYDLFMEAAEVGGLLEKKTIDPDSPHLTSKPDQKCGVCGRPWVDGKCSGGFVNHKL
jgi:hypothetical protein